MALGPTPQERAMKMQTVLLRAMSGELNWIQAADLMGVTPRTMRRWRVRLQLYGIPGLVDRRCRPSPRRVPGGVLTRLLRLYRTRYRGFNVRHFHAALRRHFEFRYSYSFVRRVLEEAGLVHKKRPRGRHRLHRTPRGMFGELLHIDGSPHRWLTLCPDQRSTLISVVDDATKRLLYAHLVDTETSQAIFTALHAVFTAHGLPMALYSDRASWVAYTPVRGQPVDASRLTQVGRALRRLGVEHIRAYSPQARGRSERVNRTLQGRLVNALRVAGIRTPEKANTYLDQLFVGYYNEEFTIPPADPTPAWVPVPGLDLDQILCFEEPRVVGKDNTVTWEGIRLQIPKQPLRRTCAGLHITVRRHLDQTHSVWLGDRRLARFDARGRLLTPNPNTVPGVAGPAGQAA